mgnify:CR=1 FL=1
MNLNIKKNIKLSEIQIFFLFVSNIAILSAIVQWLGLPSIDHDELEAVRWGATKSWFVDKHPPFVGFIAFWWAELTGYSNLAFFLLSKINAILALLVIYKLNKYFLTSKLSLIATASYASTYIYVTLMSQMDANGILHALWPLLVLFLWKALNSQQLLIWIILGILSSICILAKYQSGLILFTGLIFILSCKAYRPQFFTFNFILSLVVFLMILSPHLIGFFDYGYSMLDRVSSRAKTQNYFEGRWSVLPFIFNQMLISLFGFYILFWSIRKNITFDHLNKNDSKSVFLLFFGLILPTLPILFSIITGMAILGSWGITSWFMLPTLLLYLTKKTDLRLSLKPYYFFVPIYLCLMLAIIILNNFFDLARPTNIPKAMQNIEEKWLEKIPKPIHTVITNSRPAQGMVFYSKSKPLIINSIEGEDPSEFQWILNKNKCTTGPTIIITETNIAGKNFFDKLISKTGPPTFLDESSTKGNMHKITRSKSLKFKIAGFDDGICL